MKGNLNTKISLSLIFYTLLSDTIESSDVVVNEDLEYMVQAERNQEPYFR